MNTQMHNNLVAKKICELWLHWFERTNAEIFGLNFILTEPYLQIWTNERMNAQKILMLKNFRVLTSLVWTHERMNTEFFGLNFTLTEPYH